MLKRKSRTLAINAVFLGLLIASMCLTLIPIAGAGLAVVPLIVLVVASQIEGYKTSLFMGLALGIMSFITAFINPLPTAPIFRNPLVSILPRAFIAFLGLLVYNGVKKLIAFIEIKAKRTKTIDVRLTKLIASSIGSAITVFFNTAFVLLAIYFFYFGKDVGGTAISTEFIMGLISINFAVEIVGTTIIAPPIVLVVGKYVENLRLTVANTDYEDNLATIDTVDNDVEFDNCIENIVEDIALDKRKLDLENKENLQDNTIIEINDNNAEMEDDVCLGVNNADKDTIRHINK